MGFAYVLISCDLGSEEEDIISQLKTIDEVKEVQRTFGAYDIVAKVESDDVKKLRDTILWKIRKLDRIRSTLTLMVIPRQG
jgi:DNA-binding Lrp family transcriptional regulator